MTSLRDMNARMEQWMNEKPQGGANNELYLNENDIVLFWFASSGDDGDKLIKMYRSHAFEGRTKKGLPMDILRYCPAQNGDDIPCPHCQAGNTKFKERMSMWFYVTNILHAQMQADKQLPQVQFDGGIYFNEEVNDFRIWNTSGWRESPRGDIITLNDLYKGNSQGGLHNFSARMKCTGSGTTKRFKLYAIPNSPALDPAIYERAKAECYSIPDRLRLEINQAVAVNPQAQQVQPTVGSALLGFATPNQNPQVAPFSPPGQSIPPLQLPGLSSPSAPSQPISTLSVPTLGATPITEPLTVGLVTTLPDPTPEDIYQGDGKETPPFETKDDLPVEEPDTKPAETARRPLKSMF